MRELLEEQGYAGGKTILLWTAVVWVAALVPVLVLAAHDTGLISPLVVLPFLLPFVLLIWVGALLFIYGSSGGPDCTSGLTAHPRPGVTALLAD